MCYWSDEDCHNPRRTSVVAFGELIRRNRSNNRKKREEKERIFYFWRLCFVFYCRSNEEGKGVIGDFVSNKDLINNVSKFDQSIVLLSWNKRFGRLFLGAPKPLAMRSHSRLSTRTRHKLNVSRLLTFLCVYFNQFMQTWQNVYVNKTHSLHTHMFTHVHMCTFLCSHTCVHTCTCTHVYVHVCTLSFSTFFHPRMLWKHSRQCSTCVHVCVYMYVCVHITSCIIDVLTRRL